MLAEEIIDDGSALGQWPSTVSPLKYPLTATGSGNADTHLAADPAMELAAGPRTSTPGAAASTHSSSPQGGAARVTSSSSKRIVSIPFLPTPPNSKKPSAAAKKKGRDGAPPTAAAASSSGKKKKQTPGGTGAAAASSIKKSKSSGKAGAGKRPASSAASATSRKSRASTMTKKTGASSTTGKSKRSASKASTGKKKSVLGKKKSMRPIVAALEALEEHENELRKSFIIEEEEEMDSYAPLYNALLMQVMRDQVEQVNKKQRALNEAFAGLQEQGLTVGERADVDLVAARLQTKLESEAIAEKARLSTANAILEQRLKEKALEMERLGSEMEVLRGQYARKLARTEAENDRIEAEVHEAIHTATLDVDRMKKELGHRIDAACAAMRTPKYQSALTALQGLVQQVQEEVQDHHDTLTKLVVSIGAKDTFLKNESDTMHSNFPSQYRAELRAMEKDQLLNILDVLSYQEGVVETVGKAVYVLGEQKYKTSVI